MLLYNASGPLDIPLSASLTYYYTLITLTKSNHGILQDITYIYVRSKPPQGWDTS